MKSIAQLKSIMLCTLGQLYGGKGNLLHAGIRLGDGALTIEDSEMITDYMERDLRNKIRFLIEFSTLQWGLDEIAKLLYHVKTNQGADVQVQTETPALLGGSYVSPYAGIFDFSNLNHLGIGFEISRSSKEFFTKPSLEALFDYDVALAIINAAATKTADSTTLASTGGAGLDFSKVLKPNVKSIVFGTGTDLLVPLDEVKDFKISVKSVGEKTTYGRPINSMVTSEVEVTIYDASVSKISSLLSADQSTQLTINMSEGSNTEAWIWKLLTFKNTVKVDDKNRTQTLLFKGNCYLNDITTSVATSTKSITFQS